MHNPPSCSDMSRTVTAPLPSPRLAQSITPFHTRPGYRQKRISYLRTDPLQVLQVARDRVYAASATQGALQQAAVERSRVYRGVPQRARVRRLSLMLCHHGSALAVSFGPTPQRHASCVPVAAQQYQYYYCQLRTSFFFFFFLDKLMSSACP